MTHARLCWQAHSTHVATPFKHAAHTLHAAFDCLILNLLAHALRRRLTCVRMGSPCRRCGWCLSFATEGPSATPYSAAGCSQVRRPDPLNIYRFHKRCWSCLMGAHSMWSHGSDARRIYMCALCTACDIAGTLLHPARAYQTPAQTSVSLSLSCVCMYMCICVCLPAVQDGVLQNGQINKLKALTTAREVSAAMEYLHSQVSTVASGELRSF